MGESEKKADNGVVAGLRVLDVERSTMSSIVSFPSNSLSCPGKPAPQISLQRPKEILGLVRQGFEAQLGIVHQKTGKGNWSLPQIVHGPPLSSMFHVF